MINAVVLGGGRLPTGELTNLSKERLAAAAVAHNQHQIRSITIMGGHHSSWQSTALTFDAPFVAVKYDFLRSCGVADADIRTIEEDTPDTISEACVYWRHSNAENSVAVVTSTPHISRAAYIFQRIGGAGKHIECIGVPDSGNVLNIEEEGEYLAATQQAFDGGSVPVYCSWEQWSSHHANLYRTFADIRAKYTAVESRVNEAYGAIERVDPKSQ